MGEQGKQKDGDGLDFHIAQRALGINNREFWGTGAG